MIAETKTPFLFEPRYRLGATGKLLILPVVIAATMLTSLIAFHSDRPLVVVGAAVGLAVLTLCAMSPKIALHVMVVAFLLSPEIGLSRAGDTVESSRAITVRVEDLVLLILVVGWAIRMGVHKELGVVVKTPLNLPICTFVGINILATSMGLLFGDIEGLTPIFYCAKYIQYYLFFFMTVNLVRSAVQARRLFITALVTCAIVCVYGYLQMGAGRRISTPFEGQPEPNTLGGYLVFMLAFVIALFVETESRWLRLIWGLAAAFVTVPLLYTFSRGSYAAAVPMVIAILFCSRRNLRLTVVLVALLLLSPLVAPQSVKARIHETFGQQNYGSAQIHLADNVRLDASSTERIRSWYDALVWWATSPRAAFIGGGATRVGLLDGQYVRVLCEAGGIGFLIFMWMLFTVCQCARQGYSRAHGDFERALTLGYVGGLAGLMAHALFANTFLLVRIMEPFWFMTGLLFAYRRLQADRDQLLPVHVPRDQPPVVPKKGLWI